MFDHVTIRVADSAASEHFYNTVLRPLGIDETYRTGSFFEWRDFSLTAAEPDGVTRRAHIAFVAPTREHVDEFWRAGRAAGYADDGAPGPRPQYRGDYYAAFLLDPDGNSIEAVHHGALRRGGVIDHLWIRVRDLSASRRFYEAIAPQARLQVGEQTADRVQFVGATGSFSLLGGAPTEHLHLAFGTADDEDVREFHRRALESGYRSNGVPGERPQYHPGYYAAYVLDPDGNNVEIVNHHRPEPPAPARPPRGLS
jgi:catechol 2,3-dioxygenase-like lactoylglutathione lyase family enzyme